MTYVLAIVAGILGGGFGWCITAAITVVIAGWCGMSDFEGGRGMFAFFFVGPIGGLISMIGSAWLVLRAGKGSASVGRTLGRLAAVLVGIVALVAGGIAVRLYTMDVYTDTLPPTLEFELRLPGDIPLPEVSALRAELHTDKNVGEGQFHDRWVRNDAGANVLAGSVPLAFKTSARLLVVFLPDQPTRLFRLTLPRDPSSTKTMGEWQRPNHIHVQGEEQPRAAPADDPAEVRYRVRRAGDD